MKQLLKKIVGENNYEKLAFKKTLLQGLDAKLTIQAKIDGEEIGVGTDGYLVNIEKLPKNPIIYSAGIGEKIDFELQVIKEYGAIVYAFDPTPRSILWLNSRDLPKEFISYPYALTPKDGNFEFYLPSDENWVSGTLENILDEGRNLNKSEPYIVVGKRLKTIMEELGHDHIDILKLDIEGSEFEVIEDVLDSKIDIGQFCIDTHQRNFPDGGKKIKQLVKSMNKNGYKIFGIRDNNRSQSYIKVS